MTCAMACDSWRRRLVMMFLGAAVGVGALWINGWVPRGPGEPRPDATDAWFPTALLPAGSALGEGAAYVIYFALTRRPDEIR